MTLPSESVSDFNWWVTSVPTACKNVTNPAIEMTTDASTLGWGQSLMDKVPKECGPHLKNKSTLNVDY